jgi:hypothetical protein
MTIRAILAAGLLAGALATSSPARAEVAAPPALSHVYPLQPSPGLPSDSRSEAEELRRQISDLDASWDSLSPEQRNQRIAGLQQQVTKVDLDSRDLPQDQKAEVDAILLPSLVHLADLLRKAQTPPQGPCVFPLCLPGL